MFKYFKKDAELVLSPWIIAIPFLTCFGIDIIVFIAHAFFLKPFEEFFMPGAFTGIVFSTLFIPIYNIIWSNIYLDLAVSMGRKRKSFLINSLSLTFIFSVIESIILCVISWIYPAIRFLFFRTRPVSENFYGFIGFNNFIKFAPIFLLVILASVIFGIIYSAAIRKYGATCAAFIWIGFWIIPLFTKHISRFLSTHHISNTLMIVSTLIPVIILLAVAVISVRYLSKTDIKI